MTYLIDIEGLIEKRDAGRRIPKAKEVRISSDADIETSSNVNTS